MSIPIKISLIKLDARSQYLLKTFLPESCENKAAIVQEQEADVDLIDADLVASADELEQLINRHPSRPVILISLQEIQIENVISIQKPIQSDKLLDAILQAKQQVLVQSGNKVFLKNKVIDFQQAKDAIQRNYKNQVVQTELSIGFSEHKKTNKYKTALSLGEHNFSDFIELIPDINYEDSAQWRKAKYKPERYFQGLIQAVLNKSIQDNRALKFTFPEATLALLPRTNEIWLDADNEKLRALAHLNSREIKKLKYELIALTPADPINNAIKNAMDKFWDMDTLLWYIACWTSKGRYPAALNYDRPVFLNCWPNFTRLLVTPHALRIAALLIERPRTLANIIEVLNIKPQYVFVFISAAYALGLAGQAERNADVLIEPPDSRTDSRKVLLNQLVNKLIRN